MNISAIICEYNPFHTGHIYQIKRLKENIQGTYVLCLMSGNFVQRGGAAVLDKHTRAKCAVKNGADLVLEMPCFFSTQVAEIFAKGSIYALNSLNAVNDLCFGSESGDIEKLTKNAENILNEKSVSDLKKHLQTGKSYIKAYSHVSDIPSTSNDILAIEYIKALLSIKSKIKAVTIRREGSAYNNDNLSPIYSSATAIRNKLKSSGKTEYIQDFIPKNSLSYFDRKYMKFDDDFYKYIRHCIISNRDELEYIFEVKEGIENLIYSNIKKADTLEELIFMTKSKRYTFSGIRRILFNILLKIKKSDIKIIKENSYRSPYLRILAFTDRGRQILKKIKNNSEIALINKTSTYIVQNDYEKMFWDKDILLTNLYNMDKKSYYNDDFITSPIYIQ